jgi:hypothetical protein
MAPKKAAPAATPPPAGDVCQKNVLSGLVGKLIKPAPVEKGGIVYDRQQVNGGYKTTVQLACLPAYKSQKFTGKVSDKPKEADQYAALAAIQKISSDPVLKGAKVPQASAKKAASGVQHAKGEVNNGMCKKNMLNGLVGKIMHVPSVPKGAVVYERQKVQFKGGEGYQSTVKLTSLPGFNQGIAGEVATEPKQADQNAATQALMTINKDARLMQQVAQHEAIKKQKEEEKFQARKARAIAMGK